MSAFAYIPTVDQVQSRRVKLPLPRWGKLENFSCGKERQVAPHTPPDRIMMRPTVHGEHDRCFPPTTDTSILLIEVDGTTSPSRLAFTHLLARLAQLGFCFWQTAGDSRQRM